MATITAGDFRNGKTFEYEGKIMQVVEFQHVKPGKGAAFVRTKMKNQNPYTSISLRSYIRYLYLPKHRYSYYQETNVHAIYRFPQSFPSEFP